MSTIEFTEEDLARGATRAMGPALPSDEGMRAADAVASAYRVTVLELLGKGRRAHIARARFALYASLRALGWSYPKIGRFVGGRDPTTVLQGVRTHGAREGVSP